MRKMFGVLLLMIILISITSCGSLSPNEDMIGIDGVIYNYDKSLIINDVEYGAYLPQNFKDNIFYKFEKEELQSKSENWVINSNYEVIYYIDQDLVLNDEFYLYVDSLKEKLDTEMIGYDIHNDEEIIELEFVIDNPNEELIGYGLLISYIPIKLINDRSDIFILIPINVDVLKTKGDMIESLDKNEFIPYEQFLENEKLIKKD
jgi:hypothetical protein